LKNRCGAFTRAPVDWRTLVEMHALLAAAVLAGSLATAPLRAEDLHEQVTETVTISLDCGAPCTDEPGTRWERPSCSDYDLDTSLIEAMKAGDRSARDLLLRRYAETETWFERHRLGGALLRRAPDDRAIWNELFEHASNAVRFATGDGTDPSPEFVQWCAERQLDPVDYQSMAYNAFFEAGRDPRARPLVLEALRSKDTSLVYGAIVALGEQRDLSSLASIDQVLRQRSDRAAMLAQALVAFESEQADAIAMKYLDWEESADYMAMRNGKP